MRRLTTSLAGALALGAIGCTTHRIADLTLVANGNIPVDLSIQKSALRAEDCAFQGFGFPSLEEAIDKVQRQATESNALTNVAVTMRVESTSC